MAGELWGRQVVLQIGTTTAPGKEFRDLWTQFNVRMTDSATPNEAEIKIANVTAQTVALAQDPDAVVRLLVGYESEGGPPRLIFQGNPITGGVTQELQGVDRILKIEAQDGGLEYTTSTVAQSFAAGVNAGDVFSALADALGVPLGNVEAIDDTLEFPVGVSLSGRASDELSRLTAMSGARWGIRDGTLQVWKAGGSTGEEAIVFSVAAGNLIGSPAETDQGVEITGLLAPTLRPGKPFRVRSELITGDFVATSVEFSGDSESGPFYVKAKGSRL